MYTIQLQIFAILCFQRGKSEPDATTLPPGATSSGIEATALVYAMSLPWAYCAAVCHCFLPAAFTHEKMLFFTFFLLPTFILATSCYCNPCIRTSAAGLKGLMDGAKKTFRKSSPATV